MEKLIYLVWLDAEATRESVSEVMLGSVGPALLALGPHRLSMDLRDTGCDIPAPVPTPPGGVVMERLTAL